jgi:predicted RNase H-like HicB family nuclease
VEFEISFDREEDGRWIAGIESLPAVLAYGSNEEEARLRVLNIAQKAVSTKSQNR